MSKNKFWNKDKTVTPITDDADLENTTKQSLGDLLASDTDLTEQDVKEVFEIEEDELLFTEKQLAEALLNGQTYGINIVLDILYNYKKNMYDSAYNIDTVRVADWLKEKLKNKGIEL